MPKDKKKHMKLFQNLLFKGIKFNLIFHDYTNLAFGFCDILPFISNVLFLLQDDFDGSIADFGFFLGAIGVGVHATHDELLVVVLSLEFLVVLFL